MKLKCLKLKGGEFEYIYLKVSGSPCASPDKITVNDSSRQMGHLFIEPISKSLLVSIWWWDDLTVEGDVKANPPFPFPGSQAIIDL